MHNPKIVSSEMPEDLIYNLKILESKNNIKLFKKYNNIFILRDINKIKQECNKIKKKIIIDFSNDLKHLSLDNIELNKLKDIQNKTNNNIQEIDNLMNIINEHEYFKQSLKLSLKLEDIFIEIYEN
jgi:hypothetical protein